MKDELYIFEQIFPKGPFGVIVSFFLFLSNVHLK